MGQMMACGHAANGTSQGKPACVICVMAGDPLATQIAESAPDLSQRKARCAYYGKTPNGRNHSSNHSCKRGEPCMCEEPSSDGITADGSPSRLAFFEYKPKEQYDRFYCGCFGWD